MKLSIVLLYGLLFLMSFMALIFAVFFIIVPSLPLLYVYLLDRLLLGVYICLCLWFAFSPRYRFLIPYNGITLILVLIGIMFIEPVISKPAMLVLRLIDNILICLSLALQTFIAAKRIEEPAR